MKQITEWASIQVLRLATFKHFQTFFGNMVYLTGYKMNNIWIFVCWLLLQYRAAGHRFYFIQHCSTRLDGDSVNLVSRKF